MGWGSEPERDGGSPPDAKHATGYRLTAHNERIKENTGVPVSRPHRARQCRHEKQNRLQ